MVVSEEIEELIIAELAGETSWEEKKRLGEWLAQSAGNRKVYQEYCTLWHSGRVGKRMTEKRDEQIWLSIEQKHLKRVVRRIVYRVSAAAAVLIVLLGSSYWFMLQKKEIPEVRTVTELVALRQPGQVKLILASGREMVLNEQLTTQEAGASIQSDSTGVAYSDLNRDADTASLVYNELIVPKCGEYRLILADGTSILMNSDSHLRYPVRFTGKTREVWLKGEAFFDVAHQAEQPFIVHLDKATVKVLGTSFNVMSYETEINTEITLIRGSVDVGVSGHHELLVPGNQVAVNQATLQVTNRKVDIAQYIAWKEGVLRFDDMPLEQLMNRLSRWYDIEFEFCQEDLKKKVFSGGFRKYEPIDRILNMIQQTNDVVFRVQNNKVVIDKK